MNTEIVLTNARVVTCNAEFDGTVVVQPADVPFIVREAATLTPLVMISSLRTVTVSAPLRQLRRTFTGSRSAVWPITEPISARPTV